MLRLRSYAAGRWVTPDAGLAAILSAIDSRPVAETSSAGLDFAAMVSHARAVAGPRLRALTFQDRAAILKELALYLTDRKAPLYELAHETGATRRDSLGDIDGGIGVLFAYAARGRRELPDQRFVLDGAVEPLSKRGGFVGQHILSPLEGVAVHINAFNFPCWGLLEKFAPAFLAGVPVIAKPATVTAYLAEALVRLMIESQLLPEGSLQFIAGNAGDLLDHLTGQDLVAVTGSLATSLALRNHPAIARHAVRFTAERDSLNAAVLGPDARPGTAEFDHFMAEVVGEVTAKAGQKCTAIRRIIVPRAFEAEVIAAFGAKCEALTVGDPRRADVDIGPLVSLAQRDEVRARIALMAREAEIVVAEALLPEAPAGGYMSPVLLRARDPLTSRCIHTIEAFGPVATVMGYDTIDQAIDLVRRGEGSLVATLCSADDTIAAALVAGLAPYHGRLHILDGESAAESTGHGAPLPGLLHGGPGRAGGGAELGGLAAVHHYLQRTAIQASPARLAKLTRSWSAGAPTAVTSVHPFQLSYEALEPGQSVLTPARIITLEDIEHFARFTGDTFYAHMDEAAARANPFFGGRVAHGYLILAFAAGLFVDPAPGPLLANYGLDRLRFLKPVAPGDAIHVRLTVKRKQPARQSSYGEVTWAVEVYNQRDETVARYELLTLCARGDFNPASLQS